MGPDIFTPQNLRLYIRPSGKGARMSGGSSPVRIHWSLGGPESASSPLGSCAAPELRLPSSYLGDPIRNIGVGLRAKPFISCKLGWICSPAVGLDLPQGAQRDRLSAEIALQARSIGLLVLGKG